MGQHMCQMTRTRSINFFVAVNIIGNMYSKYTLYLFYSCMQTGEVNGQVMSVVLLLTHM